MVCSLWVTSDCLLLGEGAVAEDHSPPSCVRVKSQWRLPLFPLYSLMSLSIKWSDCKTMVQFPAVVSVSITIFLGLRRIQRAAEHSDVVSRLGRVASFTYTAARICIVCGEQAELYRWLL